MPTSQYRKQTCSGTQPRVRYIRRRYSPLCARAPALAECSQSVPAARKNAMRALLHGYLLPNPISSLYWAFMLSSSSSSGCTKFNMGPGAGAGQSNALRGQPLPRRPLTFLATDPQHPTPPSHPPPACFFVCSPLRGSQDFLQPVRQRRSPPCAPPALRAARKSSEVKIGSNVYRNAVPLF